MERNREREREREREIIFTHYINYWANFAKKFKRLILYKYWNKKLYEGAWLNKNSKFAMKGMNILMYFYLIHSEIGRRDTQIKRIKRR